MKLAEVYILKEAVCPSCKSNDAYIGFNSVECTNKSCKFFSQKQYDEVNKNNKSNNFTRVTSSSIKKFIENLEQFDIFYAASTITNQLTQHQVTKIKHDVNGNRLKDILIRTIYHYDVNSESETVNFTGKYNLINTREQLIDSWSDIDDEIDKVFIPKRNILDMDIAYKDIEEIL